MPPDTTTLAPDRVAGLVAAAAELAEQLPEPERDRFKLDYVQIMTRFHERLDERLDRLEAEATETLSSLVPHQPGPVAATVEGYLDKVRHVVEVLMVQTSDIGHPAPRALVAEAVRDGLELCLAAINENLKRTEARQKKRLA